MQQETIGSLSREVMTLWERIVCEQGKEHHSRMIIYIFLFILFFFPSQLRLSPEMYLMIYKTQPWGFFLTFHKRQLMGFWGLFFFFFFFLTWCILFKMRFTHCWRVWMHDNVPDSLCFWWTLVASLSLWSHKNTGGRERAAQGKGRGERFSSRKIMLSCLL